MLFSKKKNILSCTIFVLTLSILNDVDCTSNLMITCIGECRFKIQYTTSAVSFDSRCLTCYKDTVTKNINRFYQTSLALFIKSVQPAHEILSSAAFSSYYTLA